MQQIDAMGGSVAAIESGFMQNKISQSAYAYQKAIESKEKIIVGVNDFITEENQDIPVLTINESIRQEQINALHILKQNRDNEKVNQCLSAIKAAALNDKNLMPFVIAAVENECTLGEISDCLRSVFGEYQGS
jgi:methylmalonyl-CoA mutase N-terminal domain/subunit